MVKRGGIEWGRMALPAVAALAELSGTRVFVIWGPKELPVLFWGFFIISILEVLRPRNYPNV